MTLEALKPPLFEAVRRTAARHSPFHRFHSAEAVDAIAFLSGRDLPKPVEHRASGAGVDSRRAWIVHVKRDGKRESAGAIERGDVQVFYNVDIAPGATFEEVKDALRANDPELSTNSVGTNGGNLHRFITKMQPGDVVLMPDGSDLHLGYVDGEARFEPAAAEWTRAINWITAEEPIARQDVSPALYSRLRSLLTITDITELLPELRVLLGETGGDDAVDQPAVVAAPDAVLPSIDDDLASEWMLDRAWLEEVVGLLRRKRQVIFYGPPGTGKTYLAEKLAAHMTDDGGSYKLVQFHPSYSYEDFVEGFRPRVDADGALTYELAPGPLKLLAEAAKADPSQPYFLLIDEINRGNLAKIFGELYYLLEYREQSLVLQYGNGGEDEFSLPRNLYVIGTMNTADRSIAMVDAAIRRRFYFAEFSPTKAPISGLLSAWLRRNGHSQELAQLLDELNTRLGDDDYAIGPSYLMNEDALTQAGLERVWTYGIMPLLVEHFYGQPGATDRFELAALQRAIAPREPTPETDVGPGVEPGEEAESSSDDAD